MKTIIIFSAIALLFLNAQSCNTIEPPQDNIQPGRRDYTWTADTLPAGYPFTAIWGSSPEDVWAVRAEGPLDNGVLHFDGKRWEQSPQYIPTEPISIFGFSKKDVWMGGSDGAILHFDNSWSIAYTYKKVGQVINDIDDIYGDSPSNVYAIGNYIDKNTNIRGFILHYDGSAWHEIYFAPFNIDFIKIRCKDGRIFVLGIKQSISAPDTTILYEYIHLFAINELKQILSKPINQILNMNDIDDETYFLSNTDLCRYTSSGFIKDISFPPGLSIFDANGRNGKDIFLSMTDGIAHYNGEDIKYMYRFSSYQLFIRSTIFENEMFFVVSDEMNNKYIMLHAILNDSMEVNAR